MYCGIMLATPGGMLGIILLEPVEFTLILLDTDEVNPKLLVGYPLPVTLESNLAGSAMMFAKEV